LECKYKTQNIGHILNSAHFKLKNTPGLISVTTKIIYSSNATCTHKLILQTDVPNVVHAQTNHFHAFAW